MRKIFAIFCISICSLAIQAQTMEVGLFGGGSYYLGDLNPGMPFIMVKPAYGVVARYNYGTRWAFKLNGFRGKVAGDDAVSKANEVRGVNFESNITDISLSAEFNFFDYFTGSKRDVLTPYIFGGVGFFFYNPVSNGVNLRDIGTEGQQAGFDGRKPYKNLSFDIPFGIGVKYSLNRRLAFTMEWGMRKTFCDYIDDVSKTYYLDGASIDPGNTEQVLSDPTFAHKPYMERGNPKTNDWYNFFGISLTYKFRIFGRRGCPDQQISQMK